MGLCVQLYRNYGGISCGFVGNRFLCEGYTAIFDVQEAYKACLRAAEYDTTGIKCPALGVTPPYAEKPKYYKNAIGYIPCDREK